MVDYKKLAHKSKLYGVLGLTDNQADINEIQEKLKNREKGNRPQNKGDFSHPYGLDDDLFTPKYITVKNEKGFKDLLKRMDAEVKNGET